MNFPMNIEQWRLIDGYDNYEVSSHGRVRNNETNMILKPGLNSRGYYVVCLCKDSLQRTQKVHKLVASAFIDNPENKRNVDHIDNNGKNNMLDNLRWATDQENAYNRRKIENTSSQYKGVYWDNIKMKWRSRIKIKGKSKHLGYYDDEDEAGHAYNAKALELFGEFAKLNVIDI